MFDSLRTEESLTLLHGFVLGKFWHVLIQQVSQRLSVGQKLLVGGGELLVLLMPVLAQLPFGMQDAPEENEPQSEEPGEEKILRN